MSIISDNAHHFYDHPFSSTRKTALAERDKYEAALRKIAGWQSYSTHADRLGVEVLTEYEAGANDMLATLKQMAEEALS